MTTLKSRKLSSLLMFLLLLNFFAACGSDDDDDGGSPANPNPPQSEEQGPDQGVYNFRLLPLNSNVAGTSEIDGTINIQADQVQIKVEADATPRLVTHRQHVFIGNACPTMAQDTNGDGYLDVNEASAVTGLGLIPLDDDLSSQAAGGTFPRADVSGDYKYEESASLAQMLADLRADDTDASDGLGKLGPTGSLNLPGRVVMVQGIDPLADLPDSVGTTGNDPAHETLPIACGVIARGPSNEETPPPACPQTKSFSTRLSNQLLISGDRCTGGETVEVDVNGETQVFVCREDQWLFTVDNVNTCTPEGGCTEVGVPKVIGTITRDEESSNPPEQCTFEMSAISPLGEGQREILDDHEVRFPAEGEPVVVPEN